MRRDLLSPLIRTSIKQLGWAALSPAQRKLIMQRRISLGLAWCGHFLLMLVAIALMVSLIAQLLVIRPVLMLIARYWFLYPLAALVSLAAVFIADRILRRSWQTERQIWEASNQP